MRRLVLILFIVGCGGQRPTRPDSQLKRDVEFTYDLQLAQKRAQGVLFFFDSTRGTSFLDSVSVEKISGGEALEIFQSDEMSPPDKILERLERDDSIAFISHLDGDAFPKAILFVPSPTSPEAARGAEFVHFVGVKVINPSPPCENCPPIELPTFASLPATGKLVVVAVSESCGNTPLLERGLSGIDGVRDDPRVVEIDAFSEEGKRFLESYVTPLVPSLLVFEDGKFVDYAQTSDERAIRHLLFRNGFQSPDPGLEKGWKTDIPREDLLRSVSMPAINSGDLSGLDLKGAFFQQQVVSGTDFSGSDLRGANFNRAFVQHANFEDANLEGATFEGAIFYNTTCPDGKIGQCSGD